MKYTNINSETIDKWVEEGWEWGIPITREEYLNALNGECSILLTPTKLVPKEWFPNLKGLNVLGLASGGAQQMPVFAANGANCTLLDYSRRQIESDVKFAEREGYKINAIQGDMTLRFPFEDNSFDLIFHPVSNCYIEDVSHVWNECFRVLKSGGILMSGLDNGVNFIFGDEGKEIKYKLPFNPLKDEELFRFSKDNNHGIQFSHTLEEQIRGQILAGFKIKDLYEDTNGVGILHEYGIPTFWATLAIK